MHNDTRSLSGEYMGHQLDIDASGIVRYVVKLK